MKAFIATLTTLMLLLTGCGTIYVGTNPTISTAPTAYDASIILPSDRYPETIAHIAAAIEAGASAICTIDRAGAESNRSASLHGVPTKSGYDRDEWPMAMCSEGGEGADIAYISPKDNRGAGSWIGNKLDKYEDGTKVLFIIAKDHSSVATSDPITTEELPAAVSPTAVPTKEPEAVVYANCAAVRAAGAAPIHKGDPGYSRKLDRDGDGIGCE
ncbi:uncharacterized protein YceK [Paenibacillus castaneae]|nr:uncharacterized protein YceK [Paenibacillus castaneae]